MVKPYSTDLRERAVSAVIDGEATRAVAERFGVAVSSVSSGINAIVRPDDCP